MKRPRIILADDHVLLMDLIKTALEPHFEVVGTFADGLTLVNGALELKPDLIVLDIAMPRMNGFSAGLRLKEILPTTKLVYLTMTLDADTAAEAFRLGASAYVVKNCAATELLHAIRMALLGRLYITPLIAQDDSAGKFFHQVERNKNPNDLTQRQKEVLQLLVEGRSMKEVAYALNVSRRTVAFHKYNMMGNLHLRNSAELIRFAVNNSLVASA